MEIFVTLKTIIDQLKTAVLFADLPYINTGSEKAFCSGTLLFIPIEGEVTLSIEDDHLNLDEFQAAWAPPETAHKLVSGQGWYLLLEFDRYYCKMNKISSEGVESSSIKGLRSSWDEAKELTEYLMIIERLRHSTDQSHEKLFLLTKLSLLTLLELKDASGYQDAPGIKKKFAEFYRVHSYLQDILELNQTVEDMSLSLNTNKSSLNTICRSFRSLPVHTFYILLRLENARKLITSTEDNIKQVTEVCNFKNYDYFIQQFKKLYNITPFQFKKLYSNDELSLEDLKKLHDTNGFHLLNQTQEYSGIKSKDFSSFARQNTLIICNLSSSTVNILWLNQNGNREKYGILLPGERRVLGSEKGQYWILKGNQEHYYLTPNINSIIMNYED